MQRRYTLLLEREPDGSAYNVSVPALPGCVTFGATVDEALEHARDAIEGYLLVLEEDGETAPIEEGTFTLATVEVELTTAQSPGGG
jgi:antitoxin HicB